jgi:stage III sporulation protein AE
LGSDPLGKIRDFIKWIMTWGLKIILYFFTGYIGITGVVSGSADAAAIKAAKLTISGMVPVVGGILSDASEAVLVGAGVVKNGAGIYGMMAVLAIVIGPFLRIGIQYLLLKATAAVCGLFGTKSITALVQDFTTAMGLLLAMTGSSCLLLLISAVCFMKGVG